MGMGMSGIRERLTSVNVSNRLSTMMRDLESVRIGGSGFGRPSSENSRFSIYGLGSQHLHPGSASTTNGGFPAATPQ